MPTCCALTLPPAYNSLPRTLPTAISPFRLRSLGKISSGVKYAQHKVLTPSPVRLNLLSVQARILLTDLVFPPLLLALYYWTKSGPIRTKLFSIHKSHILIHRSALLSYHIGDSRAPILTVAKSPILLHWGEPNPKIEIILIFGYCQKAMSWIEPYLRVVPKRPIWIQWPHVLTWSREGISTPKQRFDFRSAFGSL